MKLRYNADRPSSRRASRTDLEASSAGSTPRAAGIVQAGKAWAVVAVLILTTVSCGLQLKQPRGEPNYPIEGLWASADGDYTETGRGQLLYISSPGADQYPFKFTLYQYYMRDLTVSGKRMFFTRRTGVVDTSGTEVLLSQTNYQAGFRDNLDESEEQEFWPAAEFEPEKLKRNFGAGDDIDLFVFEKDGGELVGGDLHFRRLLPAAVANGQKSQVGELDIAVVIGVRKDGREALSLTFSPVLHVKDAVRDVWNASGSAAQMKLHTLSSDLAQATVLNGKVSRGDVLVMKGWKPSGTYKRKMSRAEVLKRIQRGEPVPREDLIRVLGNDAVKGSP